MENNMKGDKFYPSDEEIVSLCRGWEVELKSTYAAAAWRLYAKFWYLSVASQPDMESEKRRLLVDGLIAPLRDAEASGTVKAAIIIHYYQLLLLAHLEISV